MPALTTRIQRTEKRIAQRQREQKATLVYVDPVFFARQKLGFEPDPWQEEVLSWEGKRLLLNCCRQSGKSTTTAILALHRALYSARSLVLLISPSLRQSSELFKKVQDFLNLLPVRPALTEDNKLSLRLTNGSRIVSLPSKEGTIRGFSGASLIIEDEASRVSDVLYAAIRPMLAVSQGQLILMSTPCGRRGHFFEAWEQQRSWKKIAITADQCPRITPEFLAEERETLGEWLFKQEYQCIFTETLDQLFTFESIQGAFSHDVPPLFSPEEGIVWTSDFSSASI